MQKPSRAMIISTRNGPSFDTERDLSAQERHVLQKLFLWKSLAESLQQFREKRDEALEKGWNNSGPIALGPALRAIVIDLERDLAARLEKRTGGAAF